MSRPTHAVLLVEDDPDHALLVRQALQDARVDAQLEVAGDVASALARLETAEPPDLVVLDLQLPDGSGLEVLERARAALRTVPVVVLTASPEDPDVRRAYELGANSYLRKPAGPEGLLGLASTLGLYWLGTNVGEGQTRDR